VALPYGCSVAVTECLNSSAVGITQLVAHEAGDSILCCALFPNGFGEDLSLRCPPGVSFADFLLGNYIFCNSIVCDS